ncbi:alpha-E domain-containing protein [Sphingosinicella xenopeptidilytica]|uniref:Alpha-E domain-containing protein n=1 Tax=Sphingosinicella xenopeptidilytica TaxID=364098 RepID=A0ABW3C5R7_SPHXN|nr:alpha-E domain-containing protein [Sphingosinicella sp.]
MTMLSRTAENLFWMTRYMERAETMARLLEVGYRIALMPSVGAGHQNDWASILSASGGAADFASRYDGETTPATVEAFLFFDRENTSSVANCIARARDNARVVRTAVTSEVWDALNGAFQDLKSFERRGPGRTDLMTLCDWTKRQTALLRGAIESTQLQQDGYDFMNLGYYIERADNTARMLDVKYYVLLPVTDRVGGGVDNYQWTTLLRAMSVFRAFHWAYGGDYTPGKIAHFLILNKSCPRSLIHCAEQTNYHLARLSRAYGQRTKPHQTARTILAELADADIDDVVFSGLHEFLTGHIGRTAALGSEIADTYLFGGG